MEGEHGFVWIGRSAGKFRPGGGEQGCAGAGLAGPRRAPSPLVDHWLAEIKRPRMQSRTRWTAAKLIHRHGTIVCTDKALHSESLSWCRVVVSGVFFWREPFFR